MRSALAVPNGDPEHDNSDIFKREKSLLNWLNKMSVAKLFDWFDAVQETTVNTKVGKARWKTEAIERDRLFLQRLGTKNGRPIDKNNYGDALKRICKKNSLPHASMHTLRHTFATRCVEAGMKPKTLQYILGHSDISTTMNIYVHITKEEKNKEMECIEQALKGI